MDKAFMVAQIEFLAKKLADQGLTCVLLSNGKATLQPSTIIPIIEGPEALKYFDDPTCSDCLITIQPTGEQIHARAGKRPLSYSTEESKGKIGANW